MIERRGSRAADAAPLARPDGADADAEEAGRDVGAGYYFYGVTRSGGWGGFRLGGDEESELGKVRYRDLEAVVRDAPFDVPVLDPRRLQEHQRVVEGSMRRGTILPAPYGVVFKGRRQLIRFLQDQYLVLDEGLALLEGNWELRLHLSVVRGEATPELADAATHVYSELRRMARAALPFPRREKRLMGAAFLVERDAWIRFVEKAEDLVAPHPEIAFDVTGPWPAYDFVRLVQ